MILILGYLFSFLCVFIIYIHMIISTSTSFLSYINCLTKFFVIVLHFTCTSNFIELSGNLSSLSYDFIIQIEIVFPPSNKLGINGMILIETFYCRVRTKVFYKEEHRSHKNNIREK